MSVAKFGKNSKATYIGSAPNEGISGMDRIELSVVLKNNNMNFLTNPSKFSLHPAAPDIICIGIFKSKYQYFNIP